MAKLNAAKKMVMQPCFRSQKVKAKKGKGSFIRKEKHSKPLF
jgi:stalled ribosome alternative rescue factor ArfA